VNPTPREEWQFDTWHIGCRVLVFDELDSTNELAGRQTEPLAIIARHQTAGRGRFGRVWRSRPGSALLLSVAFQPPTEFRRASVLTVWAAVAVAEAVQRLSGLYAAIKWPNDLLVDGRKICGILIEQGAATVVGIGLNLNQTCEEFDAAGLPLAASLASLSGSEADWKAAAEAVLRSLDEEYESLLADRSRVEEKWRTRTGLMDREVDLERSDRSRLQGTLRGLTFDEVELETAFGERVRLAPEAVEHITARASPT
jgi:BirA family biotin operon repressor/biotin-[acetyl-CoA-carboxylase] ligase